MTCSDCGGGGSVEACVNGHRGNCPCVAREVECVTCDGLGFVCDGCDRPWIADECDRCDGGAP